MNKNIRRSFALVFIITITLSLFSPLIYIRAATQEGSLNPSGAAYEINPDGQGKFWISDYDAGEIWAVDSGSSAYSVYPVGGAPSDARSDPGGKVWWGDGAAARFGRLDPPTGQVDLWGVPGASSLFGTQIDAAGHFWALAADSPYLYRFNPATGQLCSFQLPLSGSADYPLYHNGFIWLGDRANGRLLRLDPALFEYTSWALPGGSTPEGMVFDKAGSLWWADPGLGQLSRFWPNSGQLDGYDLPAGFLPMMVTAYQSTIWYSEQWNNAIGRLNSAVVDHTTASLSPTTIETTASCGTIAPTSTTTVTASSGSMTWVDVSYTTLANNIGWLVYQLPEGAYPWGVAASQEAVWFVDTGRQVLGRITQDPPASITACKLEDADGELATSNDRTPVAGWTVSLWSGETLLASQPSGSNGCYTWTEQLPGYPYTVKEETRSGWLALTPTSHDLGQASPGQQLSHNFINQRISARIFLPLLTKGAGG